MKNSPDISCGSKISGVCSVQRLDIGGGTNISGLQFGLGSYWLAVSGRGLSAWGLGFRVCTLTSGCKVWG